MIESVLRSVFLFLCGEVTRKSPSFFVLFVLGFIPRRSDEPGLSLLVHSPLLSLLLPFHPGSRSPRSSHPITLSTDFVGVYCCECVRCTLVRPLVISISCPFFIFSTFFICLLCCVWSVWGMERFLCLFIPRLIYGWCGFGDTVIGHPINRSSVLQKSQPRPSPPLPLFWRCGRLEEIGSDRRPDFRKGSQG